MIGLNRALDLLWSSRRIDAAEAYRLGLADRVVADAELLAAVEAYVADMAATVSPTALAVMKAQVHRHLETDFDTAAAEAAALMTTALAHPDAAEGANSFIERRPPRFAPWTGES
jgi:enoyl-CoA hydratase/carnithine racemase